MGRLGQLGRRLGARFGLGGSSRAHGPLLARARAAETRGDLAQATALFVEAGAPEEAARVMVLRGDAEVDPSTRLARYLQAAATAPAGSSTCALARRKRAELLLGMSDGAPVTVTLRQDLREAAGDLEAAELHELAARAWARAGDAEGEARALARAGEVDRLDALLVETARRDRERLDQRTLHERVAMLVSSGRRREALHVARGAPSDETLRERARVLSERRIAGDVVRVDLRGRALRIALGHEVVVGRVAPVAVMSAAVSRQHLVVARRGVDVVVRDLGTRNGTTLRGLAIAGDVVVGDGLEVQLGNEIPLLVRPAPELPGAVAIEVAGEVWIAPLGPARLGVGAWTLVRADDAWVELATGGAPLAYAAGLSLAPTIELIAGDALSAERGGQPVLVVARG